MTGIDRRALVDRHAVVVRAPDPRSPLSVGNGELCFTADVTGLQTFPGHYPVPAPAGDGPDGTLLGTLSNWAWHRTPGGEGYGVEDVLAEYASPAGPVPYADMAGSIGPDGERPGSPAERWLRGNPHRLDLGRIGFDLGDATLDDLTATHQVLDLWQGALRSEFTVRGDTVRVETACHPERDVLAVRVRSAALAAGRLAVRMAFPYGAEAWHTAADWSRPGAHTTTLRADAGGWRIDRTLDATTYAVRLAASPGATTGQTAAHTVVVRTDRDVLELVLAFGGPRPGPLPTVDATLAAAAEHWAGFWSSGGALDLSGSADPRAAELERRVVLSQYLTAVHCSGSLPPQETGLMTNSWWGRFHLEMHWWHAAHFALWGRPELLERSLRWYRTALPAARETAARQGYPGVRWPKQTGPDARETPSPIGPFLVWQQPHPVHLAELLYRAEPSRRVLDEYAEIVERTAEFMAGFAAATPRGHQLGPPLVPAQESYADLRRRLTGPTFELAYWQWALGVAQRWRERRGRPREPHWDAVAAGMVAPHVRDGVYSAVDVEPYTVRTDHPSMLCGLGFLPATPLIDAATMRATLKDVVAGWDWPSTWGWDYPVLAMCATRVGEPELAVQALSMDVAKNEFLPNGHNRQTASLPVYLPGNGGLLAAVALMAAGWDGSATTPGFPADGRWTVRWEGLAPSP